MAMPSLYTITFFLLAATFANALQSHFRFDDRVARAIRDETYIDTPGTVQNLCGDSTFEAADHKGPLRHDCEYLMNTTKGNPDGFWMVGSFGRDETAWVEVTRLQTCGIQVRRTDGQGGDVP